MYTDSLERLEAAIIRRNPGIAPAIQPGLPAETVRKQLKRVGMVGQVDPIVELYSWHDGMTGSAPKQAQNLGFAPRTIHGPDLKAMDYLESLGHQVDRNAKIYGSLYFFNFESVIRSIKHWINFAHQNEGKARLVGRFVPFVAYSRTSQHLALDINPAADTRVVSLKTDSIVREAYPTFADFLQDAIAANEGDRLLSWLTAPGAAIELPPPAPLPVKTSAKSKKKAIPVGENVLGLRTDFSDEAAWESFRVKLAGSDDEVALALDVVSDPEFAGLTLKQLPKRLPESVEHSFAIIIDETTLTHADHAMVIVDLREKPGRSFRAALKALADVHDNLLTANMDFAEFADAVDADKIFRGFK
jgi:hypothetical protein